MRTDNEVYLKSLQFQDPSKPTIPTEIVSSGGDSREVQKRGGGHIPVEGGGEVGLTLTVKGDEEGELTAEGNRDVVSTVSQSVLGFNVLSTAQGHLNVA